MKFCPECGMPQEPGGRFCPECGQATGAAGTSAPPGYAQPAMPGQPPYGYARPAYTRPAMPNQPPHGYAQPSHGFPQQRQEQPLPGNMFPGYGQAQAFQGQAKRPSAFAGIPAMDYVRDALAVTALFFSLFMVWVYGDGLDSLGFAGEGSRAGTRLHVLLITLLSILSVGITYLWRAGAFGRSVGYRRIQDLRLAANAPYLVMVVVYLVLVLASRGDEGFFGLGGAFAFGFAGAVLAAQPRRAELAPGAGDEPRHRRWVFITLGVAGLAAVATLVQIIRFLVMMRDMSEAFGGHVWLAAVAGLVSALAGAAIPVLIAVKVLQGSDAWRRAGTALGAAVVFPALLALIPFMRLASLDFTRFDVGFSLVFWLAFGAAVSAPSVARHTEPTALPPSDRLGAIRPVLTLTLIAAAAMAVIGLLGLSLVLARDYDDGAGLWGATFVLAALLAGGAVATAKLAARDARSAFLMGSIYAGVLFTLSLVLVVLWTVEASQGSAMNASTGKYATELIMVLAWALPFVLLAELWLDKSSREHFASLPGGGASATGFSFEGSGARGQRVPPVPVPGPFQQAPVAMEVPVGVGVQDAESRAPESRAAQPPAAEIPGAETPGGETPAAETAAGETPADPDAALLAEAADPATPLGRLQELATHPRARVAVAANPSTYPDLLTWLGQLGDPAVNEALSRRS